jgi:hypothetical protein
VSAPCPLPINTVAVPCPHQVTAPLSTRLDPRRTHRRQPNLPVCRVTPLPPQYRSSCPPQNPVAQHRSQEYAHPMRLWNGSNMAPIA